MTLSNNRVKDIKLLIYKLSNVSSVILFILITFLYIPDADSLILTILCVMPCMLSVLSYFLYLNASLHYGITPLSKEITTSAQGYNCLAVTIHPIPGQPLKTPHAQKECAWFDYNLGHINDKGRYICIDEKTTNAPFLARDEFDEIVIDCAGADLHNIAVREYNNISPPIKTKHKPFKVHIFKFRYSELFPFLPSFRGYIVIERWIPIGWKATVYGHLQTYTYPQLFRIIKKRKDRKEWGPMLAYLKSKYKGNINHKIHLLSRHSLHKAKVEVFTGGYEKLAHIEAIKKRNISIVMAVINGILASIMYHIPKTFIKVVMVSDNIVF